ncbi:DUF4230 domain-containing protein [Bailinhaonella thermotolerans]|nr:DUF4230 domain-containing protein [Bailinhaonella thermotolerans]
MRDARTRSPRRALLAALFIFIALLAVAAAGFAAYNLGWLNPFGERAVDRSQPVLLKSIQNMARFQAASGEFQVVVDLERDARFLPDAIRGERTLFVGAGTVDAYVDFSGLSGDAVTVSPDRTSVTVRLPRAALEKPNLDNKRSYVFARQRGITNRIEEFLSTKPASQQELYILAERKIAEAAAASELRGRAEQNTRLMLENLLKSLGFTQVTVTVPPAT